MCTFSPSAAFHPLNHVFCREKIILFGDLLRVLSSIDYALYVVSEEITPVFSSKISTVLFSFRPMIHFEFLFISNVSFRLKFISFLFFGRTGV